MSQKLSADALSVAAGKPGCLLSFATGRRGREKYGCEHVKLSRGPSTHKAAAYRMRGLQQPLLCRHRRLDLLWA